MDMSRSWAGDFDDFCFVASWDWGASFRVIHIYLRHLKDATSCYIESISRSWNWSKYVDSSMTVLDQLCSICRSFDSIVTNVCPTSQIFTNACPESIVAHSLWELPAIHCPTSWMTYINNHIGHHRTQERGRHVVQQKTEFTCIWETQACKCDCIWHHTARIWNLL